MKRRLIAGVLIIAVGFGCYVSASVARGRQAAVLADGVVLDKNGDGLTGIQMYVYAPVTPARGKGPSMLVATTTTQEGGSFALEAENSAELERLASQNDGWLNLDYVAGTPKLHVYRSLPRKFDQEEEQWIGPEDADFSASLGAVTLAPGAPGVGAGRTKSVRSADAAAGPSACIETSTVVATAPVTTTIGELHTTDTTASLKYGPTADSSIDAIVSWNNGASWSAGVGAAQISNTRSAPVTRNATTNFGRRTRTVFSYRKIRVTNTCLGEHLLIKANQWLGKSVLGGVAGDPTGHCASAAPAFVDSFTGSFTRNATAAGKYTGAAFLSPLGVSRWIGAVSGYSGNVTATWTAASGTHTLCGDTDSPSASRHIYAG